MYDFLTIFRFCGSIKLYSILYTLSTNNILFSFGKIKSTFDEFIPKVIVKFKVTNAINILLKIITLITNSLSVLNIYKI